MARKGITTKQDISDDLLFILSMPAEMLEETVQQTKKQNELFFETDGIKETKRQLLLTGGTFEDLDNEINALKDFAEETEMRREFDNDGQRQFVQMMIEHLEKIRDTIKEEGLFIPVKVPVERATFNGKKIRLPFYANVGDAGCDVEVLEETIVPANGTIIIPTGFKFAIPMGYEIQVRLRSSIALRTPLRIPNAPGTIDSGYRGEVGIIVWNSSNEPYTIQPTTRIAQLILSKVDRIEWQEVEKVEAIGESRVNAEGQHGFGSTGE